MPASRARCLGQGRAGQRVGLDIHHDDVLALAAAFQHMADPGGGMAGGIDDHLNAGGGYHRHRVVGDMGLAGLQRLFDGARAELRLRPEGAFQRGARAVGRQIGDSGDLHPRSQPSLGQEHGAELAGADEPDRDRAAFGGAGLQHAVEVHDLSPYSAAVRRCASRQSSASSSIGVKSRCAMYSGRLNWRIALSVRLAVT